MSDRFVIAADRLHPVPDGMSDTAAALAEPLATATHAVRLVGGDLTGQRVAVLGAGSIGLLTMLAASAISVRWACGHALSIRLVLG